MKKTTFLKVILLAFIFLQSFISYSQNLKPFTIRFDRNVKGDQLLIGNNILSQNNADYNDDSVTNDAVVMNYVDIDGDASTFSSSSAVLTIPNSNTSGSPCYKIAYAGLYWSAIIKNGDTSLDRSKFTTIKFKTPVGGYNTITGEFIFDAINSTNGIGLAKSRPYACYANVTSLVQSLTDANGTYTVANVLSSLGENGGTGLSAGWSLYIVYEDPNLPARSITSYDGFSGIGGTTTLDITVSNFRTIPSGPVNASFAFAALEGDKRITGDYLQINDVTQSAATAVPVTSLRAVNNFFNSSVTYIDPSTKKTANFTAPNRIPASSNTLGYDAGIFTIKNDSNLAIGNGATSAKITLGTAGDAFIYYFNAIAVEIIEPKIILTKAVTDGAGNPANNTSVGLGAILKYELQFQNVGNDNAKNFTITDVLPANTTFRYVSLTDNDIEQVPPGVTYAYNSTSRTITFTIPNNLVLKNGNKSVPIRFKVVVVPTCSNLTEPCNNIIKNTAKSKYTGEFNTNGGLGFGEDSYASYSTCTISAPESTNFLVGLDDCKKRNEVLCGDNVTISATGGYASYSWSTSPTGIPVIGTNQTLTVTKPGTYYVKNTATPPCTDLQEIITVADYPAKPVNPLITYADNKNPATGLIDKCENDGSLLTKIFLCGEKDFKLINLASLGATRIIWETTTCARETDLSDLCPNVSPICTWTSAAPDGNTFSASTAGQYRVSIYFGGCFSRFYFDVYKNNLNPTADKKDMICGKNGSITINGVGTGYEYSLTKNSGYQSSNTFSITTAGAYTVYIKQVGVTTNPCIFEVTGITIYKIDFDPIAPFITQPLCHDGKGNIKVYGTAYNNAQYTYELFKDGVSIEKVINSTASENEFKNKDVGDYTYTVTTLDGCSYNGVAQIIAPAALTAVASITKPLTCANGEITITETNGTAPFYYYVNGATTALDDPKIVITTAGTYSIEVVDDKGCRYPIPPIQIDANPKPLYTVAGTNILCYGSNTGEIKFDVTNPNGYDLAYSIDNGATAYVANATFSNLAPGTYKPILKYTLSGVDCFETQPDIIITEPATAVTASMGVSELAGCGVPNKSDGKVRITNPQGGVAPYQYNFNNPANPSDWTTVNDAYKAPGTYMLYVRDFNKCVFSAQVTIDPEPVAPSITVSDPVFNCDGSANSTVTVTNSDSNSFSYNYLLDGVANSNTADPKTFLNVPSGSHTISVEYLLTSVPTYSNLLNEDFGSGAPTTTSGIAAAYCFNDLRVNAPYLCGTQSVEDNQYSVTNDFWRSDDSSADPAWFHFKDHTTSPGNKAGLPLDPKGRFLLVNIGSAAGPYGVLYSKSIKDVIPNQPIIIDVYLGNLLRNSRGGANPDFIIELVDGSGTVVASQATGIISNNELWNGKTLSLNPGPNTNLTFKIRSGSVAYDGNDAVIDDIKVYQLPKACVTKVDFPFEVATGKAFTAQITGSKNVTCAGLDNGEITIAAENFNTATGYQYSINNGADWLPATTSPFTISGLAPVAYNVMIRPDATAAGTCLVEIPKTITSPLALVVDASATDAKCTPAGATVTATAVGGTPAYKYQLIDTKTPFTVVNFPTNGILTGVLPGTYKVRGTDANSCTDDKDTDLIIAAPVAPTAVIDPTSNLCFAGSGATLVVKASGGSAPYTFKLDGNSAVTSNNTTDTSIHTFGGVGIGNHTIIITDSKGCTATPITQTINALVNAEAEVTKALTCNNPKDATIQVTVKDGTAPYSYRVKKDTGTYSADVNIAPNPFNYTATTAGIYTFEITDANKCITTTDATVSVISNPTATFKSTDPSCNNGTNGEIQIIPAGGSAGYTYSFDGGAFTAPGTTTGLNAFVGSVNEKDYTYQVKDSNGCVSPIYTITLYNPTKVVASASFVPNTTCNTETVITLSGAGGSGVYTYNFDGSTNYSDAITKTFTNITSEQMITYSVKDSKGCIVTETKTIPAYNPPAGINFSTPTLITCQPGFTTTSLTLTSIGGVAPYTYTVISGPVLVGTSSTGAFSGLVAGDYTFEVKDANGCTKQVSKSIAEGIKIKVSGVKTDEICFGDKNGTATFTITEPSSTGNFDYVLSPTVQASQFTITGNVVKVTGLGANSYTLTVTDKTTGCTQTSNAVVVAAATQIVIDTVTATNVSCNKSESTIVVTATGGKLNYKYAYVIAGSGMPAATAFATTNTTINTGATQSNLSWDVYVMDQNGCIAGPSNKVIIRDLSPSIKSPAPAAICFVAGSTTALDVSTLFNLGTGTHKYTVNGTAIAGTNYNVKASGTYTIIATDVNGCSATATYIVNPELTILATRVKDLDCISDGRISFVASEGSKTYSSYEVQLNGTGAWTTVTSHFDVSVAGNYQIRVTDNAGCTAVSNIIEITPKTVPSFIANQTNISCFSGANGVITITNPTGLAPFTYSIQKGASVVAFSTIANGITATGLAAGAYTVTMTDSKKCTFTTIITLTEPTQLATTASVTTPLSCGALNATQDAIVTVVVPTTGTAPYKYSFNGGAFDTANTYSTAVSGDVTVQVQDKNLCTLATALTVTVAALNIPKLDPITGTTLFCAPPTSTTSTVQLSTITGTGVAPLSYTLVSGPVVGTTTATPGEFTGLIAGTYVFKVTDANGCTDTQSYTVKSLVNINAVLASQVDVKCNGDATGAAKITVSGFTGTYTATLTSGTGTIAPVGATTNTTIDVTGLEKGTYTVTVVDNSTGCTKDVTFTIAEPTAVTLSLVSNKNANCNTPLATVTVIAGGGASPYSYAFISTIGNPTAGDYILNKSTANLNPATSTWYVWVKDANGCEKQLATPVTIIKDAAATINVPAQQCFSGSPFTITLSGTGTGTLKYSVNGLPLAGNTYSITAAGTYKLGILDANNCDAFVDYIVDKQIFATSFLDKDITCIAPIDASITVNITNGTAPYSYQIYDGTATVGSVVTGIATTSFTKTFATPGNYSFLVKDSKGCTVQTNAQLVTPTVTPIITSVVQPINKKILCHGEETAEIVVTYNNTIGTAPFIINVKNNTTGKDYGEQTTGLKAGVYTITLTDARGCATTSSINLDEPPIIVVNAVAAPITCDTVTGKSKGSVTINGVTGGTGPYNYYVTGKFYTNSALGETGGTVVFNVVDPGIYQVIVKDANGCTAIVADLKVASDVKDLDISVILPPANCTTGGSATVAVGALSTNITGDGPFFFQIYTGQPQVYPTGVWLSESSFESKKATFTNLTPGVSYSFVIYDSLTGCYFTSPEATAIPSNSTLTAAVSGFNNVACKGESNGKVAFSITSLYTVTTPITYEIFEATTKTSTSITGVGTVPANGNISFVNIGPLPVGAYYILIKEAVGGKNEGCSVATANFNITESLELLTVTASNTKKVNCNTDSGVITASAQKGTGPYKYQYLLVSETAPTAASLFWIDSTTFKTSVTGNYIVYAKDAYGCIQSTPVTVDPEITPAIGAITPASLCYTGTAIAVTVTADATTILPVTYSVNQGAIVGGYSNNNVFNLTPGTYTLNIKDGHGCIASAPFTVKEQLTLNPIAIKKVDCKTAAPNGGITVKADGGDTVLPATYTYSITAGPTINTTGVATGIFTDLADGNYTFEVSDGTCTATTTATIDALVPIVPVPKVGIPLCVGEATSVEINATGGTGTYTYQKGAAPTLPTETINVFSQTAAEGAVIYYVKDANDCIETISVTVTDPTPIAIPTIVVNQMMCGGGNVPNDATVTVTTSGGTNDFVYSFDNGVSYSSNNIRNTTEAGTYEIIVKDSNGCITVMIPIVIDALDAPVITGFTPTQMTCPALTNDVKINYSNGIGTVAYTLVSGPSFPNNTGDTSGTYTGLAAGDYMFRITDSKGCTDEKLYTVKQLPALQLLVNVLSNVKCKGGATGKATFTASSTTAPGAFTYSVVRNPLGLPVISSKLVDEITLSDLSSGTYDVTIRDNTTNCEITKSVTITEPAVDLSITAVPSNVSCDKPISQITMSPVGGTPNYKYAIVVPGFSGAITFSDDTVIDTSALTNGVATPLGMTWAVEVYVQDANLCTAMIPITITKDDTPTVSVLPLASNQCTASGNYTFVATGTGVLPLSFSINGTDFFTSTGTTYTFTVPAPAGAFQAYTVHVQDGNGCKTTSATAVTIYKPLKLEVKQDKDLTCAPATTTAAEFTFSAADGNDANYTFAVSINGLTPITISSPYTNSTVGTYVFQVTDANNCTVQSDPFEVTTPIDPAIASTTITSPIECFGGTATMTVNVDLSKGVAPYAFVLTGAGTNNTGNTTGIYTGLVAGSYDVVVTDAKGCSSSAATQVINNPPILSATATPSTNTTCSTATVITVVGAGGTPTGSGEYYYSFDNGLTYDASNTKIVNDNGAIQTIMYSVKDANGCTTAPQPIDVNPLNKPTDLDFPVTVAPTCLLPTATISVKATNGVGALTFEIIEFNGLAPATPTVVTTPGFVNPAVFAGLIPGDYTFKVTDANGCSYQELYTVDAVVKIAVIGQPMADMTCNTGDDGKVEFNVSRFTADYKYSITKDGVAFGTSVANSTLNTIALTGLGHGTYEITVTDNTTLCQAVATAVVKQPSIVTVTLMAMDNANCKTAAQATVAGNGGTPGYTYSFVPTTAGPGTFGPSDSAALDPNISGTWYVYAKDSNNCISAPLPINIITDPLPAGFTADVVSKCPSATGTYDIVITIGTGMAPYEYSIGSGFQTSPTFTVNVAKAYDLIVKDRFGCEFTFPAAVSILPALRLDTTITALPSCTDGDGVVDLLASGGSTNYEYRKGTGVYVATSQFTGVSSGLNTFEVRDITTNCTFSVTVDLVVATPITGFALSSTDVSCYGGNDGTITATITSAAVGTNDNPIYTYQIIAPTMGAMQTDNIFNGLTKGTYTVEIASGRGCKETAIILVDEPAVTSVPAPVVTPFGCAAGTNGTNFATITVNAPTGGSGNYTIYDFIKLGTSVQKGDSPTFTESDLSGGSYTINVYDDKGCLGSTTAVINPFMKIDFATPAAITVTRAITCANDEEIEVKVTTTGISTPMPTLDYEIQDVVGGVPGGFYFKNYNGVFTGLAVGNYRITVTNPATGCSIKTIHYVNEPNTFDLTIDNVVDVTCWAGTNGSVEVTFIDRVPTPSDESGPFEYTVFDIENPLSPVPVVSLTNSTSRGPIPIPNLAAGTYKITAKLSNRPSCTVDKSFTITGPTAALAISETHTEITCVSGNNDGSISVSAKGGWPGGYEFRLEETLAGTVVSDWSTTSTFIGLTAGNYVVTVRDSKGCEVFTTVVLNNPTPIAFTTTTTNAALLCKGDTNASITVVLPVTGGQGSNYLYTLNTTSLTPMISSGPQANNVFTNLGAGTYTVTVTDGWGCGTTSTTPIVISEPTAVVANLVVATTQTCTTLSTTTLSATGGTGTYTYSADGTFTPSSDVLLYGTFATATTIPNVPVGTYRYFVRDANGCVSVVSNDIRIDKIPDLVIDVNRQNAVINCRGDNSGVIVATAQGGLGNYVYTLLDGTGNALTFVPTQSTTTPGYFTNLPAGSYVVNVVSIDCQAQTTVPVVITEPDFPLVQNKVVTNITCAGEGDGKIVITASGGTGIIKYAISPDLNQFFESNVFDDLKPGTYDYIVQDENGCFIYITGVEISEPNSIFVTTIVGTDIPEICAGDANGAFSVNITGGNAPYSVSLDDVNGTYSLGTLVQTQFDFTGLSGSEHVVYVRDANNCTTEHTVILGEAVTLNPQATVNYDCVNNSASNSVTVTVDASNLPADLDYALDGSTVFQASNVFTDVTPGRHTIDVRHSYGCIKQVVFDVVQVDPLTLALADGGLNEIVATATGGGGNYQYTLDGESYGNQSNFIIYKSGDYTVTVTDINGCTATATRYFEFIDIKIPNVFTPNGDGNNDTWAPTNTINYKDLVFYVYDRYGRKLGSYRESQFWDGKYNGNELPSGDYWYVIKIRDAKDAREFVGHFTLYR